MAVLYRCGNIEFVTESSAGGESVIVYRRGSGKAGRLSKHSAQLLASCATYATLEDHALAWCRRQELSGLRQLGSSGMPSLLSRLAKKAQSYVESDPSDIKIDRKKLTPVKQKLESLETAGLMTCESYFVAEVGVDDSAKPAPIATIGITTARRPEALDRAIRSYVENDRRYDRQTEFCIIDDSRDPATEQTTIELLGRLGSELSVEMRYAGQTERERYCQALSDQSGVDRETVRFAVLGDSRCPITTGSARNSLLLDTVGDSYLLVDDDSVCRMAAVPEQQAGLAFSSARDPTEFWFFTSREETFERAGFEDVDFLGVHEEMLGRSVASLLDNRRIHLDTALPAFEARLRRSGGTIRASMAGILGDSGIGSSAYLFVNDASRARLVASESAYLDAVRSRQVLRAARQMTVSEGAHCMAGNLGIDNRDLLPPFVPVQRNSDGKFATLLQRCFPNDYTGHMPYAGLHDPLEQRSYSPEQWMDDMQRVRFTDIVSYCLALAPSTDPWLSPEQSLARLGGHFRDLAAAPTAEFFETLRLHVWKSRNSRPTADEDDCPDFYKSRRKTFRETIDKAMLSSNYLLPRDLDPTGGQAGIAELTQETIGRLGGLLEAWPAIVSGAKSLRAKGERLARPVATKAAGA